MSKDDRNGISILDTFWKDRSGNASEETPRPSNGFELSVQSGTIPLTNLLPDYRSEAVLELHPELSDLALGLGPHAVHPPSDHLVRPQIGLDICLLFWAYHLCITRLFSE